MNGILVIRDAARAVYAKYGFVLRPLFKFLLSFLMLIIIQKNIGYNEALSKPAAVLCASVICAVFPWGFITFICTVFVIADMFAVSAIMAGFAAAAAVLIFVLYYGYRPGTGIIAALVPLMFYFKLPFVIPILLGLTAGIYSAVPAAIGVVAWNVIKLFADSADELAKAGSSGASSELIDLARQIMGDSYMLLTIAAFVLCIAVVHVISSSSISNSRVTAVSAGAVILAVLMVGGGAVTSESSIIADAIGLIVSCVIALIYVQVIYCVDYRRTERFNYEDDDYYYYVKAVPKVKPYRDEDL